jgi:predicted acetyltransferase
MSEMTVRIEKASIKQKPVVERLMQLYMYEFTAMQDADVNQDGLFEYEYLDLYWSEPDRLPFLIYVNAAIAGFVLVNSYTVLNREVEAKSIAEFFVMQKYRLQGVGKTVARRIFDMFPGKWEIREIQPNVPAQRFWRKVIGEYTKGRFSETVASSESWCGPIQSFDNSIRK